MKRLSLALVALLASFDGFATTVTSLADDGPGSLREAIAAGGELDFAVTGTITLTSGELVINNLVNITGPGADQLTIARSSSPGTPEFRVLTANGNVTISGVTLANGLIGTRDGYENGGGVLVKGALTLRNCAVTDHRSVGGWTRGTGVYINDGARLTAVNCLFARNTGEGFSSEGSAIYNYGLLALTNCTFSGNSAGYSAAIQNDAFSDGIVMDSCTIFGNTARFAPALMNGVNAAMLLRNSIVAGNSAWDGDWEIESRGFITSAGYNLIGFVYHGPGMDPVPPHPTDHTNLTASAVRLAPLANNGGPTHTHALLTNSPAFNAGPTNGFPATDQRGVERPQHARADIGAFEAQTFGPAPTNHPPFANAQSVAAHVGTPLPITLTGYDTDGDSLTYSITTQPVWGILSGTPPNLIYTAATNSPDWDLFAFKVNDGQADSAPAGVNVTVLPTEPPTQAVVTVRATDAHAAEPDDSGTFIVSRAGNTNHEITVYFAVGGSASNGVDYVALSHSVALPAGVNAATISIKPIDDTLAEGLERVGLRLVPPPDSPPGYVIASPSNAVVNIFDDEVPPKPVVTIQATDPLASESAGDPGQFTVYRTGPTDESLYVWCAFTGSASNGADYAQLPHNVVIPAGSESAPITVATIDDHLVEGMESVVAMLYYPPILGPFPPPYVIGSPSNAVVTIQDDDPGPTNPPPFVRIFTPTNGASFVAPATIQICATASDDVATIEFFAGDRSLGILTNYCIPPECVHVAPPSYCLVWSNAPGGLYTLTAKATDIFGASKVSDPVHISVGPPPAPHQPVVTIVAADAHASEPGVLSVMDPGVFTVYRSGDTSATLHVQYRIEGTASNGSDYDAISNRVVIPAGVTSARVLINSLQDNLAEGTETVTLRLLDPVCIAIYPPPPDCYRVGAPDVATVFIADTNHPPTVGILHPTNGATFTAPANLQVCGSAFDRDGYWTMLEFFAGDTRLGLLTNPCPRCVNVVEPRFCLSWSNVATGEYVLTARAVDNQGATGVSRPVTIRVVGTNAPPTNLPIVTIAAPDAIASEGTNCYRWTGWPTPWPGNHGGTNTATIVVRRAGPTNAALTVHWHLGGTASNGVDYAALPGVVTIPAGQRAVAFRIVPLDEELQEDIETVVLELRLPPDVTSHPPPYFIGRPARTAAIIVDNDQPRPGTHVLPDRSFHIMQPGANGTWWRIECSSDLLHWTPLSTNVVTDGALHFVDPDAEEWPQRFYRALPEPNPPPE